VLRHIDTGTLLPTYLLRFSSWISRWNNWVKSHFKAGIKGAASMAYTRFAMSWPHKVADSSPVATKMKRTPVWIKCLSLSPIRVTGSKAHGSQSVAEITGQQKPELEVTTLASVISRSAIAFPNWQLPAIPNIDSVSLKFSHQRWSLKLPVLVLDLLFLSKPPIMGSRKLVSDWNAQLSAP